VLLLKPRADSSSRTESRRPSASETINSPPVISKTQKGFGSRREASALPPLRKHAVFDPIFNKRGLTP